MMNGRKSHLDVVGRCLARGLTGVGDIRAPNRIGGIAESEAAGCNIEG
jgi:hypothetical protein